MLTVTWDWGQAPRSEATAEHTANTQPHLLSPLQVLSAFVEFGFYDATAYDDIADSITYCNHYLAPVRACPSQLASAFAAFAKYEHERGDLFVALARCEELPRVDAGLGSGLQHRCHDVWPGQSRDLAGSRKRERSKPIASAQDRGLKTTQARGGSSCSRGVTLADSCLTKPAGVPNRPARGERRLAWPSRNPPRQPLTPHPLALLPPRRGFSELSLAKLGAEERKGTVLKALRAFHRFNFWPDATGASYRPTGHPARRACC